MTTPLMQLKQLGCADGDFRILQDIDLEIYPGLVYQLIGANNSGKTALFALMGGVRKPTAGIMLLHGAPVHFRKVQDAIKRGVILLEENPHLFPHLSIAENIVTVSRIRGSGAARLIRRGRDEDACRALFEELALDIDPSRPVSSLSLAQQRILELVRVYYSGAALLIIDGLAGWASAKEIEQIYSLLQAICRRYNTAVIFCAANINHSAPEGFVSTTVYLKHGKIVACLSGEAQKHIPLDFQSTLLDYPKLERPRGRPLLQLRDFRTKPMSDSPFSSPNSMTVYGGEIVGIYGMDMPHCQALHEIYTGCRHDYSGELLLEGVPIHIRSPRHALQLGIVCQPLTRRDALFWNLSLQMNLCPAGADGIFLSPRFEHMRAVSRALRLHIHAENVKMHCSYFGSGACQKVLISRYLDQQAKLFILFHPTADMDSRAKLDIYNLINLLQHRGCGVILFSNDLDELAYMCDRSYVVCNSLVHAITGTPSQRAARLYRIVTGR